jgi:MFS-type transporter involved in bile tolerance (Atg22 family)
MTTSTTNAKSTAVIWGIAAIVTAIFVCTVNSSNLVLRASFVMKVFAVLAGAALGTVFAVIGDAFRRYAHPDVVITNGGFFSLIGTKLFWQVGPQLIGLFSGVFLGVTLVLK